MTLPSRNMNQSPTTPPSREHALKRHWKDRGYVFVFGLIIISFIVNMAGSDNIWNRLLSLLLQSVTLFTTLKASHVRSTYFTAALALFTLGIIAAIIVFSNHNQQTILVTQIAGTLLLVLIILAIIADVGRDYTVNVQSLFGALCIYLLMGMFFAYLYATVGTLTPPFFTSVQNATIKDYLYFSYITQATVGYGDLVPAGNLPRALVVIQALIGQIYLVTVIALLVGNYGKQRPPRHKE